MRIACAFAHANLEFRTSTRLGSRVSKTMIKVSLLFATITKFFRKDSIPATKVIGVSNPYRINYPIATQGEVTISERKYKIVRPKPIDSRSSTRTIIKVKHAKS